MLALLRPWTACSQKQRRQIGKRCLVACCIKEIQSGFSYLGWSLGKVSLGNWALWSCPVASSGWNWKWRSATDARHETWTSLEEFARVKWWDETPLVPIGRRQALDSWFKCLFVVVVSLIITQEFGIGVMSFGLYGCLPKVRGDDFSDCVQQLVTVVLRGCTHIQSLIAYSLSNTIVFLLWVAATASWVCQTTTFLFISTLELSSGTCRWKTWFEKDLFCMCLTCARLKYIGQVCAALLHKILLANEFDMFLKEAFVVQ